MNNKPPSSKCTTNETKQNITASKLRRLKIEENILMQALKKLDQKSDYEVSESYASSDIEFKKTVKEWMDSYTKIKTLFDDIKIITNTQELLADVEIDEIKKKVLELETTMRSFKKHLDTELNSLKNAEAILVTELEQIHLKNPISKKQTKMSSASLKQAVPSPVRLLMTSPLKCTEVQEFQDFMKNSSNRYGGWNEYHHNIFATLWKKYFGNSPQTNCTDVESTELAFDNFIEESLLKLQGIDKNNLLVHVDWYKKYLHLKSKQQTAIDKWKLNRRSIRKVSDTQIQSSAQNEAGTTRKKICEIKKNDDEATKQTSKVINSDDIERIMKPTKQWLSRCYDDGQIIEQFRNIEHLEKLGIPKWRQHIS